MKKLNILFGILIGLTIFSCSSDDTSSNNDNDMNEKKLIKVTVEGNYGIYEKQFIYDSDNNVTEIESSFTEFGQTISDVHNTVFSYNNNLIISAINYEDGTLFNTIEFNYSNDNLIEKIVYDADGIEDEKFEFTYNSSDQVEILNYYVESDLQQTQNFTYDTNANIIVIDDIDYSEIQYDTNQTPSNSFTNSNKIIFEAESFLMNIGQNNETNRTTTYNYSQANEVIIQFATTITYDSDNYPISKIVTQTEDNTTVSLRTTTFEYE